MDEYQIVSLNNCKRCGTKGFERLPSYSHCVNCNYSQTIETRAENESVIPDWAIALLGQERLFSKYGQKSFLGTDLSIV